MMFKILRECILMNKRQEEILESGIIQNVLKKNLIKELEIKKYMIIHCGGLVLKLKIGLIRKMVKT